MHRNAVHPVGNTGITVDNLPALPASDPTRTRANIELSSSVSLCLDHVSEVTGATRSQIINSALLEALPGLIERADTFLKRGQTILQLRAVTAKRK